MHIGMYATTHGLMYRDDTNAFLPVYLRVQCSPYESLSKRLSGN